MVEFIKMNKKWEDEKKREVEEGHTRLSPRPQPVFNPRSQELWSPCVRWPHVSMSTWHMSIALSFAFSPPLSSEVKQKLAFHNLFVRSLLVLLYQRIHAFLTFQYGAS